MTGAESAALAMAASAVVAVLAAVVATTAVLAAMAAGWAMTDSDVAAGAAMVASTGAVAASVAGNAATAAAATSVVAAKAGSMATATATAAAGALSAAGSTSTAATAAAGALVAGAVSSADRPSLPELPPLPLPLFLAARPCTPFCGSCDRLGDALGSAEPVDCLRALASSPLASTTALSTSASTSVDRNDMRGATTLARYTGLARTCPSTGACGAPPAIDTSIGEGVQLGNPRKSGEWSSFPPLDVLPATLIVCQTLSR